MREDLGGAKATDASATAGKALAAFNVAETANAALSVAASASRRRVGLRGWRQAGRPMRLDLRGPSGFRGRDLGQVFGVSIDHPTGQIGIRANQTHQVPSGDRSGKGLV